MGMKYLLKCICIDGIIFKQFKSINERNNFLEGDAFNFNRVVKCQYSKLTKPMKKICNEQLGL